MNEIDLGALAASLFPEKRVEKDSGHLEVETKFLGLSAEEIEAIRGKLKVIGVPKIFHGPMRQIYFRAPNGLDSRLRLMANSLASGEITTEWNRKIKKSDDGIVRVNEEPEVTIRGDQQAFGFETMRRINKETGLVETDEILTYREVWDFGEHKVFIVDGIVAPVLVDPYLELEGRAREDLELVCQAMGMDLAFGSSISKRDLVHQALRQSRRKASRIKASGGK